MKMQFNTVAATFATPSTPAGWPDEFRLAAVEMTPIGDPSREWLARVEYQCKVIFNIYGATREEAESRARLLAWTIANQRPIGEIPHSAMCISRQIYEDLKRDHAALLAAVDGPGGYREQIAALKSEAQDRIVEGLGAPAMLASHLTEPAQRIHLRSLLDLVASGKITPDDYTKASDSNTELAALLLRVRGTVEVSF